MSLPVSPRRLGRGVGASLRRVPGSVVISVAVLGLLAVCVVCSSLLAPGALDQNLALGASPAGTPGHLLGTDKVGRDVLALTVAGARSAIVGPLVVALGSMAAGVLCGMSAAWWGGLRAACDCRPCVVLLSLPDTFLAIVVAGVVAVSSRLTLVVLQVHFASLALRLVCAAMPAQTPHP